MSNNTLPASRHVMARFEAWYGNRKRFGIVFLAAMALLALNEIFVYAVLGFWDWLFISGAVTALLGLRLAVELPERQSEMLRRLRNTGALVSGNPEAPTLSDDQLTSVRTMLAARSARWAQNGGLIGAGVILLSFSFIYKALNLYDFLLHLWNTIVSPDASTIASIGFLLYLFGEIVVGYIVGYYLGFAASNGGLQRLLASNATRLHVNPKSLDEATGFSPLAEFYLYQAGLLALPAFFLAVWWSLMGTVERFIQQYAQWRTPYSYMLALVLIAEGLAFIVPMWALHQTMQQQKAALQEEADRLNGLAAAIDAKLALAQDDEQIADLRAQREEIEKSYQAIVKMPTWPLKTTTQWALLQFLLAPLYAAILGALAAKFIH